MNRQGMSLPATGELRVEIDSSSGLSEPIKVTGDVALGGAALHLVDRSDSTLPAGTKLTLIRYSGVLDGSFSNAPDGAQLTVGANTFTVKYADEGALTLSIPAAGEKEYADWVSGMGVSAENAAALADPDGDGRTNLMEFALDSDPLASTEDEKISTTLCVTPDDENALVITLPVRTGAVFPGSGPMVSNAIDGVIYTVEGSADPSEFGGLALAEIEPLDVEAMPELPAGWEYRSFRTESATDAETGSLRVRVDPAP